MVVGQDPYVARDALELVQVDYEPLPATVDPLEAMGPGAVPIHPELGTNTVLRLTHGGGDPSTSSGQALDSAFAQADYVVRQQYRVQRLAPAPLETRGVVADYQPRDDLLTVWDSTQHPHEVKEHLCRLLDRPGNRIRVVAPDVGGGFGEKGCLYPEEVAVPYLSVLLKRPIKWVEDRQENMLAFHGRGHTVDVEAAVQRDGSILGMRVRIVADLGAYFLLSTPTVPVLTSHRITGPYRIPAISVEVVGVVTNKPPTGSYRGAGGPEAAFCMERTVDLIARDLDLDPAEVRRKNFISPDAFPYETPTGITYDSGDYDKTFDRALELSEYFKWRQQAQTKEQTGAPLIGIGLATVVKGSGARAVRLTDHARVTIEPSGRVTTHTGVSPHGQGTETTFSQIVADELGVTPSSVRVLHGDTDALPSGGGTSGSRGLMVGGTAMYFVLQQARQKLAAIASHLLHCPAEEVIFREGQVFNRQDPAQETTFAQVAAAAHDEELLPPGVSSGLDFSGSHTLPASPYAFGAHVAVVEVSPENGAIRVLRYVAVHDSGHIINPMLAEGQVQGGIAQGIGQALLEGMVYSPEGQPLTGSLLDYALPRAESLPDLTLDTTETPSPLNPLGVKGIGELPTLASPVAVANAVMDALSSAGVRHIDTPLTPEKVWQALQGTR
jgi:carbon-monoxide dehydrogenase large subunit